MEVPVNYLAVIAAAVSAMVIGFLWYGPLFGKQWKKEMGYTDESMRNMKQSANQSYAIMAVTALLQAYVLSHIYVFASTYMEVSGYMAGLSSAFWVWLGFVATTQIGVVLWENKSWKLLFLNAAYSLVSLAAMGIIISSWPA